MAIIKLYSYIFQAFYYDPPTVCTAPALTASSFMVEKRLQVVFWLPEKVMTVHSFPPPMTYFQFLT